MHHPFPLVADSIGGWSDGAAGPEARHPIYHSPLSTSSHLPCDLYSVMSCFYCTFGAWVGVHLIKLVVFSIYLVLHCFWFTYASPSSLFDIYCTWQFVRLCDNSSFPTSKGTVVTLPQFCQLDLVAVLSWDLQRLRPSPESLP